MPVDNNLQIVKKEGAVYPPIPKNVYPAELLDISSELRPTYGTRNKPSEEQKIETVLSFQFTLLEGQDKSQEGDLQNLRGRNVWINFVPTYLYIGRKGKNNLYRIIEALIGRELTREEEAVGFTGGKLNGLISRQCRLSIEPKTKDDKTYDNIVDFLSAGTLLNSLTEAEKEKARVKDKDEQSGTSTIENGQIVPANTEQGDEIGGHTEESTLNVEEIPFN